MNNKSITKDKKIFIILLIVLLFLLIIIGVTIGVSTVAEENKKEVIKEKEYSEKMTITCTNDEETNDIKKEEEVYLENGVLLTRTDRNVWNNLSENSDTCKYYQTQAEGLNRYVGVSSNVNCNETSGTSSTTYTISEINRSNLKLNQFDYINEKNILDYQRWVEYMTKKGYSCKVKE